MTNLKCRTLIVGAVLLVTSSAVFADNSDNAVSKGVYVQADIGYGKVKAELADFTNDQDGVMGDINVGYNFNKNFALEVGFAKFSDTTADLNGWWNNGDGTDVTKNNYYFDIAAKGILPLSDKFDLFIKPGIAFVHSEWADFTTGSDSNFKPAAYCGAGADFYLTSNLALTLQASTTTKSGDDTPAMYAGTLGVTYHFGG